MRIGSLMDKKLVLFDFDGVIADSFDYSLKIIQILQPHMTDRDYRDLFEGNFYERMCNFVGKDEISPEYQKLYWKHFLERIDEIKLVEGMEKILETLSKKFSLVVISSSDSTIINMILDREKVAGYVSKVYGSDVHLSKEKKFKMIFADHNITARDCIFVTDTLGDLLEAENIGTESIAVSWGFHDTKTLEKGKCKAIIQKPERLIVEIEKHFDQRK